MLEKIRIIFLSIMLLLHAACTSSKATSGWYLDHNEVKHVKKVAVLPFEGYRGKEASDFFAFYLQHNFPKIELIERDQLLKVISEQDLYPSRLNPETRAKIGNIFEVQALVLGNVKKGWSKEIGYYIREYTVKIVDPKTGKSYGHALGLGGSIEEASEYAVRAFKSQLNK